MRPDHDPPTGPAEQLRAGELTLRRWDASRIDELDDAINASLPELSRFMPWASEEHSREDTLDYVVRSVAEWDRGENWNYAILTPQDQVIGSSGLMTRMGPGVLEIGYWVHSAHAGRGYATAAAIALADEGLRQTCIERVVIKNDVANEASGRVAAKAGFVRIGEEEVEAKAAAETGVHVLWERRA